MDQKGQVVGLPWLTNGDMVSWRKTDTQQPAVGGELTVNPDFPSFLALKASESKASQHSTPSIEFGRLNPDSF